MSSKRSICSSRAEFEHCMFVLGIDDEIVDAALNKSNCDVFVQMPWLLLYNRYPAILWKSARP
jgi:hypothetical protein